MKHLHTFESFLHSSEFLYEGDIQISKENMEKFKAALAQTKEIAKAASEIIAKDANRGPRPKTEKLYGKNLAEDDQKEWDEEKAETTKQLAQIEKRVKDIKTPRGTSSILKLYWEASKLEAAAEHLDSKSSAEQYKKTAKEKFGEANKLMKSIKVSD